MFFKKFLLSLLFAIIGILTATLVFAQTCDPDYPGCATCPPHIYQGINCGSNWYCGGCVSACFDCPRAGDPTGATVLNYVSCTCQCPAGQIVCSGACTTPPTCPTPTREQANTCTGCGACKAGYSPDPLNPNPPAPCLKTAYMDYANTGYFQVSGDLKSTGGDLYLASGKAIRIDGNGTTTLSIGNWGAGGTGADVSIWGNLNVGGATFQRSLNVSGGVVVGNPTGGNRGVGTLNAEQLCMQGSCRTVWPEAVNAFVDEGNVGFGPTAVLGTNDNVPLAFETNNIERMRIDTAGNVGIGTNAPNVKLTLSNNVASGPLDTYGEYQLLLYDTGNPSTSYGLGIRGGTMVFNSNDNFHFDRNGSTVMVISGGNVGIGTTAPAQRLEVSGNVLASGAFFAGSTGSTRIQFDAGTLQGFYSDEGTARFRIGRDVFGGGDVGLELWGDSGIWRDYPAGDLKLRAGSADRVTILNNGNVGIGTTAPDARLTIAGSPLALRAINSGALNIVLTDTSQGVDQKNWQISNSGSALVFGTLNDAMSASAPLVTVLRNGNTGIGTTTPGTNSSKLEVKSGTARVYVNAPTGNPELDLGNGTKHWAIYSVLGGASQLRFWQGDDRVVIDELGHVGIGTTGPIYTLDVVGQIRANTDNTPAITGQTSAPAGYGVAGYSTVSNGAAVFGSATDNGAIQNRGGWFTAAGQLGIGVYGEASNNTNGPNYGGYFVAQGTPGTGVYGEASASGAVTNTGGYFWAKGDTGRGVFGYATGASGYGVVGYATGTSGIGVYGYALSSSGWAGYFTGGKGLYADKLVGGSAIDPGTYKLYVVGNGNITNNLVVDTDTLYVDAINNRVGIRNSAPEYSLHVTSAEEKAIFASTSSSAGVAPAAIQGLASASGDVANYGGLFQANGQRGRGVTGIAFNETGTNYGGYFSSKGNSGYGVYALAEAIGNVTTYGGYFESTGNFGYGVYGTVTATSGTNYGVYGTTASSSGWAGYFTGGQGVLVNPYLKIGTGTSYGVYRCTGTTNKGVLVADKANASTVCGGSYYSETGLLVK